MRNTILLLLCLLPLVFQLAVAVGPRPAPRRPAAGAPVPSSSSASPSTPSARGPRFRRQAAAAEPFADPQLPQVPSALTDVKPQCLFWQYIQAQPLSNSEVKDQIQELCVSGNGTDSEEQQAQNNNANGGWCEVDLEVVIKQIDSSSNGSNGSMLRMEPDLVESIRFHNLKIYIHFTQNGIWQVVEIPDCNSDSAKLRVVRSLF